MEMEWKKWRLQAFGRDGEEVTDSCVIEAPSLGVAVEMFLAVHGLLGCHNIISEEAPDAEPDEDRESVEKIMHDALTQEKMEELDDWHSNIIKTSRLRVAFVRKYLSKSA